ncbi:MAG: Spy/CpxP family protein refolding chaperone [Myxococcota bacterium]
MGDVGRNTRLALLGGVLAICLAFAIPAAGQPGGGPGPPGGGFDRPHGPPPHAGGPPPHGGPPGKRRGPPPLERVLERHSDRLALDAETRDAIDAIALESRDQRAALQTELKSLHDGMRGLLSTARPDEAAVMQQAEKIGAAETELEKSRLRSMLRIRALLTREQLDELVEIHKERREKKRERRGFGPR